MRKREARLLGRVRIHVKQGAVHREFRSGRRGRRNRDSEKCPALSAARYDQEDTETPSGHAKHLKNRANRTQTKSRSGEVCRSNDEHGQKSSERFVATVSTPKHGVDFTLKLRSGFLSLTRLLPSLLGLSTSSSARSVFVSSLFAPFVLLHLARDRLGALF